jgi:preprotein translocase subunit SecF
MDRELIGASGFLGILVLWVVVLALHPDFGVAMFVGMVLGFIASRLIDLMPDLPGGH